MMEYCVWFLLFNLSIHVDDTSQVSRKHFQSAKGGRISQKYGGQVRPSAIKTAEGGQGLILRSVLRYIVWF